MVAKLAFHAKESPIRTRAESSVFVYSRPISPAKGYSPAVRGPPNPGLPQTVADASVAFLEDGEGEGDSAKSEMMVASSVKLRLRGGGIL